VFWSLPSDDASLLCVGLSYGGQRIERPIRKLIGGLMATWDHFSVDSQAGSSLVDEDCLTVFTASPAPQPGGRP